jgi:hypothetical protein
MANNAAVFSLSPALVNPGQLIDYANPAGAKVYASAVKPLCEAMYILDSDGLGNFLLEFDVRLVEYGWEAIFGIPEDVLAVPPILRMMTVDYGIITMDQVVAHVNTYIQNNDRNCQNSFQAFNCLMATLSEEAKKKINLNRQLFTIDGIGVGPLLLKTIIQTAYVDTRSTVLHLREQLSRLDEYMIEVKSDIERFNDYVKTLVSGLNARGERTLDLLSNLFKGYMSVSDDAFIDFIKRKKDAYEEGDIDLTPTELMESTVNKYNGLRQQGRWNVTSEQDEKIIALQAQIQALLTSSRKIKKVKGETSQPTTRIRKLPDWAYIAPKPGEPETKTVNGKTYYWCNNHHVWSLNPKHTTSQCRGYGVKDIANLNSAASPAATTHTSVTLPGDASTIATAPSLQLIGALAPLQPEDEEEE